MPAKAAPEQAKSPKRARAPMWAKLLTVFGVVLTLTSVGGIVSVRYFLGQLTGNIQTTSSVIDGSTGGLCAGKLVLVV